MTTKSKENSISKHELEAQLRKKRVIPVMQKARDLEWYLKDAESCLSEILFGYDIVVDKEERTRFYKARRHVINAMKEVGLKTIL